MVKVINCEGLIAGRLAATAAKESLEGEPLVLVNVEKAVITGNPKSVIKKYLGRLHKGHPLKGPYTPRRSDRILRRMIRGMLPYKSEHGKKALKRIKLFIGLPKEYEGKAKLIDSLHINDRKVLKYLTIKELSKQVGGVK